jgi:hypothetical protein
MTVVNLQKEPYDIYIGRPGKWGNPFIIGKHGNRHEVIERYFYWIVTRLQNEPGLRDEVKNLKGKKLGCYCYPKECHGDVLEFLAEMDEVTWQEIFTKNGLTQGT